MSDSASGTLEVREAHPDEEDIILAYYRSELRSGDRVADVMRWRAASAAASGGNAPALAFLDGTLSGIVNSVPVTLTQSGRRITAAWQGDSFVSKTLRGRGVGKKLVQAASVGATLVLAKGTTPAMYALRKSVGAYDVGNAEYLVRGLGFAGSSPLRSVMNGLLDLWGSVRSIGSGSRIRAEEATGFSDDFDALEARLSASDEIRVAKPAAFLRWRYEQAPGRRYRVYRVDVAAELRGAFVLREPTAPGADAWLIDLIVDPRDQEVVRSLVQGAIGAARKAGAGGMRTFATSARVRAELFRLGFIRTKNSPEFTCWVRDAANAPNAESAWHVCHGDGDLELY